MTDPTATITAALDQLAAERTPAQVAARLEMDACIGIRRSYDTCPVAEWLLARTGYRVHVGPGWWAHLYLHGGELPPVVAEFVSGFDRQCYPALDVAVPA